ncbi:hypothetical protein ACK3TF_001117 [Chlorella vulgaris]
MTRLAVCDTHTRLRAAAPARWLALVQQRRRWCVGQTPPPLAAIRMCTRQASLAPPPPKILATQTQTCTLPIKASLAATPETCPSASPPPMSTQCQTSPTCPSRLCPARGHSWPVKPWFQAQRLQTWGGRLLPQALVSAGCLSCHQGLWSQHVFTSTASTCWQQEM